MALEDADYRFVGKVYDVTDFLDGKFSKALCSDTRIDFNSMVSSQITQVRLIGNLSI